MDCPDTKTNKWTVRKQNKPIDFLDIHTYTQRENTVYHPDMKITKGQSPHKTYYWTIRKENIQREI